MPRPLLALLSLLALAIPGALVAACGSDDIDPASVAEAAETTRGEGSARIRYEIKASGMGLPSEVALDGEGVTALDSSEMDLTLDLGPVLALAGQEGDGETRLVVSGGRIFLDPPAVDGLELPGGDRWVGVEFARVLDAAGIEADAIGAVMTVTPEASLGALEAAGKIEEVGEEEIDGVTTTHFRGEVRTSDYIETLPQERREAARKALDELFEKADIDDEPGAMDVWVDDEGRVRRIRQGDSVPPAEGVPGGKAVVEMTYSDFGTELDVEPPAQGDTFDATGLAVDAIEQGAP